MSMITDLKSIYEIDDHQWLEETVKLLKEKRFADLDLDNLIQELEDLGRSDKNAIASFLEQIIRHLLLLQFWTEKLEQNTNHWQAEIASFRKQVNRRLTTNLTKYLTENLAVIYQDALEYVQQKTGFRVNFPEKCPYSLEQLLDKNYLPNQD